MMTDVTHCKRHIFRVVNVCIVPALSCAYDSCLYDTHGNTYGDYLVVRFVVNANKPVGVRKATTIHRYAFLTS